MKKLHRLIVSSKAYRQSGHPRPEGLRFDAGNAVSYGMSQRGALNAVTSNVADVFGINAGSLEVGKAADVVVWSNDPFELSSHVSKMIINGEEVSTQSRQDKLRERYTTDSTMPRAYTK